MAIPDMDYFNSTTRTHSLRHGYSLGGKACPG